MQPLLHKKIKTIDHKNVLLLQIVILLAALSHASAFLIRNELLVPKATQLPQQQTTMAATSSQPSSTNSMKDTWDELAKNLSSNVQTAKKKQYWVAIAGGPGSGELRFRVIAILTFACLYMFHFC